MEKRLVDRLYADTTRLLLEAFAYHSMDADRDAERLAPHEADALLLESSRVTARLAAVTAWLLAYKGFLAGEIQDGDDLLRLAQEPGCSLGRQLPAWTPASLHRLATASLALFERVGRLDAAMYGAPGGGLGSRRLAVSASSP